MIPLWICNRVVIANAHLCGVEKQLCGYCSAPYIKNLWKIPYNPTTKMKLSQLFKRTLVVVALFVIAVWSSSSLKFLAAGNVQSTKQDESETKKTIQLEESQKSKTASDKPGSEGKESGTQKPPAESQKPTAELMKKSLTLLRSQSLRASIRQRGMLFGTELIASGSYLQAEGGKGGVKTEFELQTQNLSLRVEMINDGVYYFRQVKSVDDSLSNADPKTIDTKAQPTVERINLREIRDRMKGNETWPGHWIAFGGLYHFVDQSRRSFDFGPVKQKKIKGKTYAVIKGTWKPEKLASLIPEQKDSIINRKAINWQLIPRQIPLEVEIYFVEQGKLAGFPFRIVFYRPSEEMLEGIRNLPVLITEYSGPEIVDTPLNSDFQFNAAENEVVDITEDFLSSLKL